MSYEAAVAGNLWRLAKESRSTMPNEQYASRKLGNSESLDGETLFSCSCQGSRGSVESGWWFSGVSRQQYSLQRMLKPEMTGLHPQRFWISSIGSIEFPLLLNLTLCYPTDCNPPVPSICRLLQARILEWVAISFSRGSSQPRDWTRVSCVAGGFFSIWATREAHIKPPGGAVAADPRTTLWEPVSWGNPESRRGIQNVEASITR